MLVRTKKRWMCGVLGGIAQFFGIHPDVLRLIVLASFFIFPFPIPGAIAGIYIVGWLIIPSEEDQPKNQ